LGVIQRQGISNTIITYAGIVIGFVNLIIIQPLFLTTEEIGLIRVLFSFSALLSVFIPLGIGNITIRYFPYFRDREQKHHGFFGFMLIFPLVGFLFVSGVLLLFRDFFIHRYSEQAELFAEFFDFVFPLSFFLGLINVLNIYAFALYKPNIPSLLNEVVQRVLTIAVVAAYYLKWINLDQFIIYFVLIFGVQLVLLLLYIFKIDRPGFKVNTERVKEQNLPGVLQYGLILSFAGLASLGLKYLDSIMLANYLPLSIVGVYSVVAFVPAVIEAPLHSLDKIAGTRIAAALAEKDMHLVKSIYLVSSKYMLILGGLLFAGITSNINSLLEFLPEEFSKGGTVVIIISIGTLFTMASGSNNSIILNSEKYKFGAFLLIFLAVLAIVNNLLLIPPFGIEGAALATAISAFIYNLAKYLYILKHYGLQPFDAKTVLIILIIAVSTGIGYILPDTENAVVAIIYKSFVITAVYGASMLYFKIAPELAEQIINKFKGK
jgi:O-antigen/teichoic acid export membrane protein